ncbi:phage tail domain-containing protein [Clostridium sp. YIM B02551]|uniref:phage distal tail protein n=1 Tax=Clostridium sp. YIM B02551 TaxID=2910679 RepID=UPI001EEC82FC|nr:phage tail domain-containing protein [Clostridium sp. YIM B02551]
MLINNIDINNFGSNLLEKQISTAESNIINEWIDGAFRPIVLNKNNKYIAVNCKFVVKGDTKQALEEKKSVFLKYLEICTVKFEDIDFYFDCILQSKSNEYIGTDVCDNSEVERADVLLVSGYKYKPETTELLNRLSSKTLNVPGNIETPAIVEITPSVSLVDLVVTGLGDSFTIKNLTAGQKVIISGEDGTVLQNGANKFGDYDCWDFPKLQPGANTITLSKNSCDVNIKYKPRWI